MGRLATQTRVTLEGDRIRLQSPYNPAALDALRRIWGRHWDRITKTNTFPANPDTAAQLLKLLDDFHPDAEVQGEVIEMAMNGNGKRVKITEVDGGIEIKSPYSEAFVDRLKDIDYTLRAWRKDKKVWFFHDAVKDRAISLAREFWPDDIDCKTESLNGHQTKLEKAAALAVATKVDKDEIIKLRAGELYPFQCAGVHFLELMGSGIIADQMGLGKTVQALAFLARGDDRYPALVVCPASVKMNWAREVMRWIGDDEVSCDVVDGSYSYEVRPDGKKGHRIGNIQNLNTDEFADILIINYDVLNRNKEKLLEMEFKTVVLDESHYVKNFKSKRSEAAKDIASQAKHKILLTGTPVMNRPAELWHQLHIISPEVWPKFFKFAKRYCDLQRGRFGWTYNGATNLDELHRSIVGTYMVRRRKMEVIKDMPKKVVYKTNIDVDAGVRQEYNLAFKNFRQWALNSGGQDKLMRVLRAEMLTRMTTLKRLAAEAKVETAVEHIVDFLESREEDQLVVFAHHRSVLEGLYREIRKSNHKVATIFGGDSMAKRQQAIDDFRDGRVRVIVCSIMAAGTGVDGLQVAQNMMFLERTWRPADHQQAEDRIHRIGQTDICFVEYLDLEDSIDEVMANILENKRQVASKIVDGKVVDDNYVDEVMKEVLRLND